MYDFFIKNFDNYIIEESKEYLIFLITGEKLASQFDWYGEQRAEAFNVFKTKPLKNDIEERDFFYTHMIIWDKETNELAVGQRFLFNQKGFSVHAIAPSATIDDGSTVAAVVELDD